jgi:glycerol-3-phosphate dehydrogenase (NAD(P)+)
LNTKFFNNSKLSSVPKTTLLLSEIIKFKPNYIILAIPSSGIIDIASAISKQINFKCDIINVAKGLDPKTKNIFSKTIKKIIPKKFCNLITLIGPSFATEVFNKKITIINAISSDITSAKNVAKLFTNNYFKVVPLIDEIGGQIFSALKNILAIVCGYIDNSSINTRAAFFSEGVKEIQVIALSYGAKQSTLTSFCGIGDIYLTCSDKTSRNYSFGVNFRENNKKEIEIIKTVEGIKTLPIIYKYITAKKINAPIFIELYKMLFFTTYNKHNFITNVYNCL